MKFELVRIVRNSPRRRTRGSDCGAGRLHRCCWWRASLPACRRCTERQAGTSVITLWPLWCRGHKAVSKCSEICHYWQYLERRQGERASPSSYASLKHRHIKQRTEKPERGTWNYQKPLTRQEGPHHEKLYTSGLVYVILIKQWSPASSAGWWWQKTNKQYRT